MLLRIVARDVFSLLRSETSEVRTWDGMKDAYLIVYD